MSWDPLWRILHVLQLLLVRSWLLCVLLLQDDAMNVPSSAMVRQSAVAWCGLVLGHLQFMLGDPLWRSVHGLQLRPMCPRLLWVLLLQWLQHVRDDAMRTPLTALVRQSCSGITQCRRFGQQAFRCLDRRQTVSRQPLGLLRGPAGGHVYRPIVSPFWI